MIGLVVVLGLALQAAPAVRTGTVTGQLQTREGAPASAVRIFALGAPPPGVRPEDGTQYYTVPPPASTTITDDQGRYRLTNVPPGRYYIVAGALGQATYHPGVDDSNRATVIQVTPGSMATMDFKLVSQLGGRVSGRVRPAAEPGTQERAVLSAVKLSEIIEMPVKPDGSFDFGHVPKGSYLLNLFPLLPGMGSLAFEIGDADMMSLEFVKPALHTVSGRIAARNGPLPNGLLAFYTNESYVAATINPDLTFSVKVQSGRHQVDVAGMPGGYSLATVRAGSTDVTQGLTVGNSDVSGVVITVTAPRELPRVGGRIAGYATAPVKPTHVEMTGPIFGKVQATVQKDGSFTFGTITPGRYDLRLPDLAALRPINVVVGWDDVDVPVSLPMP
jgi:hypothetical protein